MCELQKLSIRELSGSYLNFILIRPKGHLKKTLFVARILTQLDVLVSFCFKHFWTSWTFGFLEFFQPSNHQSNQNWTPNFA